MGGTRDGEIYEFLDEKEKAAIEKLKQQTLVPLNKNEVELALQIKDKQQRAKLFRESSKEDLENEMKKFLEKEKGYK